MNRLHQLLDLMRVVLSTQRQRRVRGPEVMPAAALAFVLALAGCSSDEAREAAGHDHDAPVQTTALDESAQKWTCGMHPHIVQNEPGQCPICGMDLVPMKSGASAEGVVEIDPVTMQNMGVRTARVQVEPLGRSVRTTGRFEANERLQTVVSPKVSGWVERLHVDYEGARVRKGQPLLEIYSPELVSTQEEYLLALRGVERMPESADSKRLLEAAERRLAYWDISAEQVGRLKETGTPAKTLTLYAPASGTVTQKNVTQGQEVRAGQSLLHLSGLSQLWLMIDVYEQDLAWIEVGSTAEVVLPHAPGQSVLGKVDYIYDELDPELRAAKARITVPNPSGQIKPGMYATVVMKGRQVEGAPVVPAEAVISSGTKEVVVLALGDGRFQPVEVTTGLQSDGRVQVLDGLEGGEEVVTSAQFLIDSEARLKSAVGAMAGHDHGSGSVHGGGDTAMSDHKGMTVDVRAADRNSDGIVYQCSVQPHLVADGESAIGDCDGAVEKLPVGVAQSMLKDAGYTHVPVDPARADANGDGRVWQSPMHLAVLQDAEGRCDICGMYLEEVTIAKARENLSEAGYWVE